jgi:hypothetical protein
MANGGLTGQAIHVRSMSWCDGDSTGALIGFVCRGSGIAADESHGAIQKFGLNEMVLKLNKVLSFVNKFAVFISSTTSPNHDSLETRSISGSLFIRIIHKPCSLAAGDQLFSSRSICNVGSSQNNISIQTLKCKSVRCASHSSHGAFMLVGSLPERLNMS